MHHAVYDRLYRSVFWQAMWRQYAVGNAGFLILTLATLTCDLTLRGRPSTSPYKACPFTAISALLSQSNEAF